MTFVALIYCVASHLGMRFSLYFHQVTRLSNKFHSPTKKRNAAKSCVYTALSLKTNIQDQDRWIRNVPVDWSSLPDSLSYPTACKITIWNIFSTTFWELCKYLLFKSSFFFKFFLISIIKFSVERFFFLKNLVSQFVCLRGPRWQRCFHMTGASC